MENNRYTNILELAYLNVPQTSPMSRAEVNSATGCVISSDRPSPVRLLTETIVFHLSLIGGSSKIIASVRSKLLHTTEASGRRHSPIKLSAEQMIIIIIHLRLWLHLRVKFRTEGDTSEF